MFQRWIFKLKFTPKMMWCGPMLSLRFSWYSWVPSTEVREPHIWKLHFISFCHLFYSRNKHITFFSLPRTIGILWIQILYEQTRKHFPFLFQMLFLSIINRMFSLIWVSQKALKSIPVYFVCHVIFDILTFYALSRWLRKKCMCENALTFLIFKNLLQIS